MKIITVTSAKGGVGKSTFCCGVAKMLAFDGKRILLVDMDIGVRSLDILLSVSEKTVYNWGDVLKGNCDYRKAVLEASKDVFLLPAPIDFNDEYTTEKFSAMINEIKKDFDYIFLDAPAGLEKGFELSSGVADICVVVSTPDAISIRAAAFATQCMKKEGVQDVRLVVNKFNKKFHKDINVDDFIDNVGARLLGIIPESTEIYQSVNGKKIPYDCKGSQAFLRISKRISGKNIPLKTKLL